MLTGPVKISTLNVRNRLQLADGEDENMTEHIIGTHQTDLMQLYNRPVTIRGSLTLVNALVSSTHDNFYSKPIHMDPFENPNPFPITEDAVIIVGSSPFALENVTQEFWMKSKDQVIFHLFNLTFGSSIVPFFMFRRALLM